MSNSEKHIKEAIKNIEEDRQITRELLDDAIKWLSVDEARHNQIGGVLAKYVETLQRSNEQLVKLCGLMKKGESTSDELTDKDFAGIFDAIQNSEKEDK
jgi:hypothetical protein|tara:strand:- start:270 stop:566 length:297 start_codon:yes stop_codon:yes gene_type:complete